MSNPSPLDAGGYAKGKSSAFDPQLDFWDHDLDVLPSNKALYRVDEAAEILKCSQQQIRDLGDSGELEMVPINAHIDPRPRRLHCRVTGRSLAAFVNRRRKLAL